LDAAVVSAELSADTVSVTVSDPPQPASATAEAIAGSRTEILIFIRESSPFPWQ
jgi:hypothetical protein